MPPRLPRLTLYTGGKECSLCEVAKAELSRIGQTRPFDLEYFNIRSPPATVDAREAKRWRRLYQYDIVSYLRPSVFLDKAHLVACPTPRRRPDPETPHQRRSPHRRLGQMASSPRRAGSPVVGHNPYPTPENSRSSRSYAPYRSVIAHVHREVDEPEAGPSRPPWRRKLGEAWFGLNSEIGGMLGEDTPGEEAEVFGDIVSRMFRGFAEREDWAVRVDDGQEEAVEIVLDVNPERGGVEGVTDVLYTREEASTPRSKPTRPSQLCWNCREPGHILADCPQQRDHLQIRASREAFMAQKDTMPDFAQPYLAVYVFTEAERHRRLDLLSRFTPGILSEELKDALFWVEEEEPEEGEGIVINPRGRGRQSGGGEWDGEESASSRRVRVAMMAVRRKRGDWPWFEWMLKWGYPPGWVAGKNPMDEVRRRLEAKPIETDIPDSDSEDDLEVFGEQNEVAPLPASRSARQLLREGSADMVLLSPTPSPPPSPPPPPDDPAPSPPPSSPEQARTPRHQYPPQRRWVDYNTQQFDSERLVVYSEARPLPLGH